MAETKKKVTPVKIAEVEEETAVATTEEAGAVATTGAVEMGAATGEVGASDIKFPTLRIIQKMSENPEKLKAVREKYPD